MKWFVPKFLLGLVVGFLLAHPQLKWIALGFLIGLVVGFFLPLALAIMLRGPDPPTKHW